MLFKVLKKYYDGFFNYEFAGKRSFDIICSFLGLLVLFPFFIVLSLLIKSKSSGPVFFLQERIGRKGKTFNIIKFRTMYSDHFREKEGFTPGDVSRVTTLGKILRKTKFDEFPELINVLKGDMSFVGPRPEVPKYRHIYSEEYESVLSMRPGITDYASIKYRNEEKLLAKSPNPEETYKQKILPDKLRLTLSYKKGITFRNDLKIIYLTLINLIKGFKDS